MRDLARSAMPLPPRLQGAPGSPAIADGGASDSEWDQRGPGYPRMVNGMTDIGAYEVQPTGAGAAALTLHSPKPINQVLVVALSSPSTPSIPLRPAAAVVDQVFAAVPRSHRGFDGLPKRQTVLEGTHRHRAVRDQEVEFRKVVPKGAHHALDQLHDAAYPRSADLPRN